jgi:hypothetical protein
MNTTFRFGALDWRSAPHDRGGYDTSPAVGFGVVSISSPSPRPLRVRHVTWGN